MACRVSWWRNPTIEPCDKVIFLFIEIGEHLEYTEPRNTLYLQLNDMVKGLNLTL